MTIDASTASDVPAAHKPYASFAASPNGARGAFLLIVCASVAAGLLVTGGEDSSQAVADAGPDLTRLLRAMAGLKVLIAAGIGAGVLWRLGTSIGPLRFASYAAACAAMAAGPGLIWDMAHVALGAALLHGGGLAAILLLWRDPAVGERLAQMIASRRSGR